LDVDSIANYTIYPIDLSLDFTYNISMNKIAYILLLFTSFSFAQMEWKEIPVAYSEPYIEQRVIQFDPIKFEYVPKLINGKPVLKCVYIMDKPFKGNDGKMTREFSMLSNDPFFYKDKGFPYSCNSIFKKPLCPKGTNKNATDCYFEDSTNGSK